MVKIIGGNGTGKTRQLMMQAKEQHGVFVCSNVERYRAKAHAYGIVDLPIISYTDLFTDNYDKNLPVFINKIDKYLETCENIGGFSLTVE